MRKLLSYQAYAGNPLPYTGRGIDSPRSFAYKMQEQIRARTWYKGRVSGSEERFPKETTSLGEDRRGDRSYQEGYVGEMDTVFAEDGVRLRLSGDYLYADLHPLPQPQDKGKAIKPYLPGMVVNNNEGYVKPYRAARIRRTKSPGWMPWACSWAPCVWERSRAC